MIGRSCSLEIESNGRHSAVGGFGREFGRSICNKAGSQFEARSKLAAKRGWRTPSAFFFCFFSAETAIFLFSFFLAFCSRRLDLT